MHLVRPRMAEDRREGTATVAVAPETDVVQPAPLFSGRVNMNLTATEKPEYIGVGAGTSGNRGFRCQTSYVSHLLRDDSASRKLRTFSTKHQQHGHALGVLPPCCCWASQCLCWPRLEARFFVGPDAPPPKAKLRAGGGKYRKTVGKGISP